MHDLIADFVQAVEFIKKGIESSSILGHRCWKVGLEK
jgi:hypothetical protein